MRNKRGQVTLFIIIGIIILVVVALSYFIYNNSIKKQLTPEQEEIFLSSQIEPISNLIDRCITRISLDGISILRDNSGYLTPLTTTINYNGANVAYLVYKDDANPNKVNPKSNLEADLAEYIKTRFKRECNLDSIKDIEIIKDYNNLSINVDMEDNGVQINLNFPLTLKKGNSESTISNFNAKVNSEFGLIYNYLIDIINKEVQTGTFDITKYQLQNPNIKVFRDNLNLNQAIYTLTTNKEEEFVIFAVKR